MCVCASYVAAGTRVLSHTYLGVYKGVGSLQARWLFFSAVHLCPCVNTLSNLPHHIPGVLVNAP